MVKCALDLPQFQVLPWEIEQGTCSYTIETLRHLHQKRNAQYHLLLSAEAAAHLDRWKDKEELLRLAPPLVAPREIPISSTQIRERLKKKLYCGHLVPAKALDYISANELYLL